MDKCKLGEKENTRWEEQYNIASQKEARIGKKIT
jgi:hypothetical protein